MHLILPSLTLVLSSLASAVPINSSDASSQPSYLALEIYHQAKSGTPCAGLNGTLNWSLGNVIPNSTDNCFDDETHHKTCIRRKFTQADGYKIDTVPRTCEVEGYMQGQCLGSSFPASYNGAAEWTWDGIDMGIDIQSFKMYCAVTGAVTIGVSGD